MGTGSRSWNLRDDRSPILRWTCPFGRSRAARESDDDDADALWVSDGTRTRDVLDHNQVLYQLSYTHHANGPNMFRGPHCAA